KLLLNQNDFNRREQLLEVEYQLALQAKQYRRSVTLFADSIISQSEYEPAENQFSYFLRRQALLKSSLRQDSLARQRQLEQINAFEARLLDNLRQVRAILDRLVILAPTKGRLGDFSVQTGEALSSGQRLGEIYQMEALLAVAEADEFYLNKITEGQLGYLPLGNDSIALTVTKIYPTVENGRFRLDVQSAEVAGVSADTPQPRFTKGQS
ncbi:MAG: HlyD family efflux transporter periplasmic adaptor subunit, partial [Bacteroidota bacterium]